MSVAHLATVLILEPRSSTFHVVVSTMKAYPKGVDNFIIRLLILCYHNQIHRVTPFDVKDEMLSLGNHMSITTNVVGLDTLHSGFEGFHSALSDRHCRKVYSDRKVLELLQRLYML